MAPKTTRSWARIERSKVKTDRNIRRRIRKKTLALVHWMEAYDDVFYVPYGWLNNSEFVLLTDVTTGLDWYCRVLPNGELTSEMPAEYFRDHENRKIRVRELRYTYKQYEVIRTCVWRMSTQDWSPKEIFALLSDYRLNWEHLPGQTPLTVGKVAKWYQIHVKHLAKGIQWP